MAAVASRAKRRARISGPPENGVAGFGGFELGSQKVRYRREAGVRGGLDGGNEGRPPLIIGFVHDWANPENTRRSWDMVARYVVPEINGYVAKLRESQKFVIDNRAIFERAGQAVMAKIMENDKAAAALQHTGPGRIAIPAVNAPDLQKEAAKRKA